MRARGAIAFALLLALGVCASSASAAPLSMTFTEARANVGVQLADEALFEAPDTAPLAAELDPGSGAITAGALEVPQFATHITVPIDADVTVDFDIGEIEGSFTQATGALTLKGRAGGTLTATNPTYAGEECLVSTTPEVLELTTATAESDDGAPRSGASFYVGLTGPGAIAGEWDDMEATPADPGDSKNVTFCEDVEGRIGGPGGVWLEQKGVVLPLPTPPKQGVLPPPTSLPLTSPPQCVVPKLVGKTLARAKAALRAASCKTGKIRRERRLEGKGRQVFVVKSSNPAAGASPADGRVHLKLGPKLRK